MSREAELDAKNAANLALWQENWRLMGGSIHWQARPLMDLRNQDQLRQYRVIELKRRQTGRSKRRNKVVNIAAWHLKRMRNGKQRISA